jgi:hypothetical protein
MEVKIGVQNSVRELVLDSAQSSDEVSASIAQQITDGGVLSLTDEKGRRVLVPVASLAYVEIGEPTARRVGFAAD